MNGKTAAHLMASGFIPLFLILSCGLIRPEERTGDIIDASRNIEVVLYHAAARPDNPFPEENLVFVRHFCYADRSSPWRIMATGQNRPRPLFEEFGVYLLHPPPDEENTIIPLIKLPRPVTEGLEPPRVHLALARPSRVFLDGVPLLRNITGKALIYVEDGPLYGDFTVDVSDTAAVVTQNPRLLVDEPVHAAALSSDGGLIAYVDERSRLFTLDTASGGQPKFLIDLRASLGPVAVTRVQWSVEFPHEILIRLERAGVVEAWEVDTFINQLSPAGVDPETIAEPGADRLTEVDRLTRDTPSGVWRTPTPERFQR